MLRVKSQFSNIDWALNSLRVEWIVLLVPFIIADLLRAGLVEWVLRFLFYDGELLLVLRATFGGRCLHIFVVDHDFQALEQEEEREVSKCRVLDPAVVDVEQTDVEDELEQDGHGSQFGKHRSFLELEGLEAH